MNAQNIGEDDYIKLRGIFSMRLTDAPTCIVIRENTNCDSLTFIQKTQITAEHNRGESFTRDGV